jgi:hypothetical protein
LDWRRIVFSVSVWLYSVTLGANGMNKKLNNFIKISGFYSFVENYEKSSTGFSDNFERLDKLIRGDERNRLQKIHEKEIESLKNEMINKNRIQQLSWNIFEYCESIEKLTKNYKNQEVNNVCS